MRCIVLTTPTLDNGVIDLGTVGLPESFAISTGIFKKALPLKSSKSAVIVDVWGKEQRITITGTKSGSDANLKTWVEQIEAWANGDGLQERKVFKSSIGISYNVRCELFNYDLFPNKAVYKMVFLEAGL